jgi:hypothetical protein
MWMCRYGHRIAYSWQVNPQDCPRCKRNEKRRQETKARLASQPILDEKYRMTIHAMDAVLALKWMGTRACAKEIATKLGGTDSRAVATALRNPVRSGQVTLFYKSNIAWYKFVRLSPKKTSE